MEKLGVASDRRVEFSPGSERAAAARARAGRARAERLRDARERYAIFCSRPGRACVLGGTAGR